MTTTTRNIHLAIAFDINFLTPFYVLLTSLFLNNRSHRLHLHVVAAQVPESEREALVRFAQQHKAEIHFYDVSKYIRGLDLPVHSRFTEATYYRLFLPVMIPESAEQVLFIDTDTVVVNSLQELYDTNIGRYPVGAVIIPKSKPHPDLGILVPECYFNAGVLLIDLAEWKRQQVTEKCMDFIRKYPERLTWADQDALNAVLVNNFFPLPSRYNVRRTDIPKDLAPSQYNEYLKDKAIIHFNGPNKPWAALGYNPLRFLYHKYLKKSPRSSEKKYVDLKPNPILLLHFISIRLNEYALDHPLIPKTLTTAKSVLKRLLPKHQMSTQ